MEGRDRGMEPGGWELRRAGFSGEYGPISFARGLYLNLNELNPYLSFYLMEA